MTSSKFVLLESIVLDPLKLIFATSSVNFSTYPEGSFCAWPSHRNSAKYLDTNAFVSENCLHIFRVNRV